MSRTVSMKFVTSAAIATRPYATGGMCRARIETDTSCNSWRTSCTNDIQATPEAVLCASEGGRAAPPAGISTAAVELRPSAIAISGSAEFMEPAQQLAACERVCRGGGGLGQTILRPLREAALASRP